MKTLNNILKTLTLLITTAACCGCSDFLEDYSQDQYYVKSWEDLDELLIGSGYMEAEYQVEPSNYGDTHAGFFLNFIADEISEINVGPSQDYDNHQAMFGYYTWQQRPGIDETLSTVNSENGTWTRCYYHINVCNNIINSLDDVPVKTEEEQQGYHKVNGEAHFIRAYLYFFLANLYGKAYNPETAATDLAVPIKTSPNVEDVKFSRNTVQEVYDLVLSDLDVARTELTLYTTEQKSIHHADSVAAFLLSSRVYLYMQDWENAVRYADKVIENHPALQNLASSTGATFETSSNIETIFSMGKNDCHRICHYGPQGFTVTPSTFAIYDTYDYRRTQWFWHLGTFTAPTLIPPSDSWSSYTETNVSYYYMRYQASLSSRAYVSDVFWLRSGEAYLNKAEALCYLGRDSEAQAAVNQLKVNRYTTSSPYYKETATGDSLAQDIRLERRKEFILQGHRWFDLRRYAVCQKYPQKTSIQHEYTYYTARDETTMTERHRYTLTEDDPFWTLPIPKEVLDFNTGMPDNGAEWRTFEDVPIE